MPVRERVDRALACYGIPAVLCAQRTQCQTESLAEACSVDLNFLHVTFDLSCQRWWPEGSGPKWLSATRNIQHTSSSLC